MEQLINAVVISNTELAPKLFSLWLYAPTIANNAKPGQFVEIYLNDGVHLLPRPISICDADKNLGQIRLVVAVVGVGTERISTFTANDSVKIMGPVGNGFTLTNEKHQAVVGGGVGIPPLLFLAKEIKRLDANLEVTAFMGFRSAEYLTNGFLCKEFAEVGVNVSIATDDGSAHFKGNVLSLMKLEDNKIDKIYTCGPKIMMANVANYAAEIGAPVFVSLEEKMACGIGICVGCVVKIADETSPNGWVYKKVCKDGPVFNGKEVLWNE